MTHLAIASSNLLPWADAVLATAWFVQEGETFARKMCTNIWYVSGFLSELTSSNQRNLKTSASSDFTHTWWYIVSGSAEKATLYLQNCSITHTKLFIKSGPVRPKKSTISCLNCYHYILQLHPLACSY